MDHGQALEELLPSLPAGFFDRILRDIPADAWIPMFKDIPTLREAVLEGFSTRPDKLPRLLVQPKVQARLRRILQSGGPPLEEVLNVWGLENLSIVAFLEMLDREFLLENRESIKNLIGPERMVAGLYLLGRLRESGFLEHIDESFWERSVGEETLEPLVPFGQVLKDLAADFPEARRWLGDILTAPAPGGGAEPQERPHREEERRKKIELKLEKTRAEQDRLQGEITRYRRENEELRKKLTDMEQETERRVEEAVDRWRAQWHTRFQPADARPFEDAAKNLESLLKRAEHAFELQKQADEQYGMVPVVRRQLLQVKLHLKEIERIYADSLMVHPEVAKVKEALVKERKRLLQLPGMDKVLRGEPSLAVEADLREHVHLLEAAPENLPRIIQIRSIATRLAALEFIEDADPLLDDIDRKKRQIFESLYDSFHPPREALPKDRRPRNLDDFVRSGEGKQYDVYVDGYNILLKLQHAGGAAHGPSLAVHREAFIDAVCGKSSLFRKVFLVFDGTGESRDLLGNVEVVYTDRSRGNTADTAIIQMLRRRKDNRALLVTRDLEIIRETENRVFALIDPYHFYGFVFDANLPPGR